MIGAVVRILTGLAWLILFAALFYVTVWVLNRGLQILLKAVGFEARDFLKWLSGPFRKNEPVVVVDEEKKLSGLLVQVDDPELLRRYGLLTSAEVNAVQNSLRRELGKMLDKLGSSKLR